MARTFRRQRGAHPIAELNITNLVDLGFTLLIIFMIAASLIKQEQTAPIELPSSSRLQTQQPDRNTQVHAVSVDAAGKFFLDEKAVTLVELRSRLRGYAADPKPPIIRIRGDRNARYDKVYQIFDECQKANLLKVTIDSQTEG